MSKSKWLWTLPVIGILTMAAYTAKVLPDPYFHQEKVTFAEWVKREIHELRYGEAE